MNDKQSLPGISGEIVNDLRNIATATGILSGICYFIGYLIMNFYLSRFGAHYASLVQARYFTTGFLYVVMSALVGAAPLAAWSLIRTGNYSRSQNIRLAISAALMSAVTIWGLGYFLVKFPHIVYGAPYYPADTRLLIFYLSFTGSQLLLWLPALFVVIAQALEARFRLQNREQKDVNPPGGILAVRTGLSSFIIVIALLLSVYSYAIQAYSQIPTTFGGGAPKEVRLLFSDETSASGLDLEVEDRLSEPVLLLDQSDRALLVVDLDGRAAMEISTSLVAAVIHRK